MTFFLEIKKIQLILQTKIKIDPWCNGSTADFGSACLGSNPGGSTKNKNKGC